MRPAVLAIGLLLGLAMPLRAEPPPPLTLGLYPYLSPEMMTYRVQPLISFLAEQTGHRVKIQQANSYQEFFDNGIQGSYDLMLAPSHFASEFTINHEYQSLLLLNIHYSALVVSNIGSQIRTPQDLKRMTLAIPDRLALVTQVSIDSLAELGVEENMLVLNKKATHDRSLHSLFTNESDAAVVSSTYYNRLPEKALDKIRVVHRSGLLMGDIILAHQDLKVATEIETQFPSSPYGVEFIRRWKLPFTLDPIDEDSLMPLLIFEP